MQFQKILLLGAIIIGVLSILWFVLSVLLTERIPNALKPEQGYIFDYVVVGAGTAGSVVAALLAKHSNATVLLIEAGETFGLISKIPVLTTFQQMGLNDWAFKSVPQRFSSKGLLEQRQSLPRGKGLGGSAQLNYMLHFDGDARDFEKWSTDYNLTDWRWESVKSFLEAGRAPVHEMLEIARRYSKLTEALQRAETEFAHRNWRFRPARYTIKHGLRHSVLQRFLQPAFVHKNLRIMTNAMAKQLRLTTHSEDGVRKVRSLLVGAKNEGVEQLISIEIRHELILSAGTYQTPQLLLASGIGNASELRKLQIPVQLDLPQVGKQLHDHLNFALFISIDVVGPTLNQRTFLNPLNLLNYLITGAGPFGNFGVVGHVFAPHTSLTFFGAGAIDESSLMAISNFERTHFRAVFPRYYNETQEGIVLISTCLQPKSRGSVTISSTNVRKAPLIDPNYLSVSDDIDCTIRAVRAAVEIVNSDAFRGTLRPHIHWPKFKACANFGPLQSDFETNMPSDRYLECAIRQVGLGSHHPGGSCAMGLNSKSSVVDTKLRLHGVDNVRIVDASVFPTPISGNPNSVIVGMAVRGATMILKEQLEQRN